MSAEKQSTVIQAQTLRSKARFHRSCSFANTPRSLWAVTLATGVLSKIIAKLALLCLGLASQPRTWHEDMATGTTLTSKPPAVPHDLQHPLFHTRISPTTERAVCDLERAVNLIPNHPRAGPNFPFGLFGVARQ